MSWNFVSRVVLEGPGTWWHTAGIARPRGEALVRVPDLRVCWACDLGQAAWGMAHGLSILWG